MLKHDFLNLVDSYIDIWDELEEPMFIKKKFSHLTQTIKYFKIKSQMKRTFSSINIKYKHLKQSKENLSFSKESEEEMWVLRACCMNNKELSHLIELWLELDIKNMENNIQGDYIGCTEEFIKRVKETWPNMEESQVFQALRNVWIMIALKIMFSNNPNDLVLTNSIFAYSMLYPLTDNLLDNPNILQVEKLDFSKRLEKRLKGNILSPKNTEEKDIFDMISLIEQEYCRKSYPKVYESLLLIHEAQTNNIKNQYMNPEKNDIKKSTFEKGAASVVADGYLVMGDLTQTQMDFLTGYGIVLQLADDLQDIEEDEAVNHTTIANSCPNKELQEYILNLLKLSEKILDKIDFNEDYVNKEMKIILLRSMETLISDAVLKNKKRLDTYFYKRISKASPIGLEKYLKLKNYSIGEIENIKPKLMP
ncbi:hypothetical protein J2Z35_000561 [Acetoanaerobium pronyense]|uniref:Terpene synthase n=1 Tax=Acetoanaerobium pronyense TaxID=1482736 RepID=A0ABS4KG61_9FIRM|nr:hypothetical protein [Acetoanaerobium pronyense]MBP2026770.1 hypothetical protein [Acetoanaerobium pronyense]